MAEFDTTKIHVCLICLHLVANGEYNDGTDAAEQCAKRQDLVWGGNQMYFTLGDCDPETCEAVRYDPEHECEPLEQGFSHYSCDGCEDTNGGDRFLLFVMIPKGA